MAYRQILRSTAPRAGAWWLAVGWIGLVSAGCANLSESRQTIARNRVPDISPVRQRRTEEVARDFDRNRDEAQFEAAASCWQRGDAEGSKQMLTQLLERNPNFRRARFVLADIYLFNGDSEGAINELQKAAVANPRDAMAHHALAQVLDAAGRRKEALSHYQAALSLEPANELYALSYHTILSSNAPSAQLASMPALPATQSIAVKAKAGSRVTISDQPLPPTAAKNSSAASKQKPAQAQNVSDKPNQQLQSVKLTSVDDWVRPIDFGNDSPDKPANDTLDKSPSGEVQPQLAQASAAPVVAGPVSARQSAPGSVNAPVAKSSDGSTVVASYSVVATKPADPQNRHNPLQRAVEALAGGDTAAAIDWATTGLAQAPERSEALYRVLGAAHYRRGEYQAAQNALAQALSLDKSDALAYFLMGSTLAKQGQSETAARCFAEAARLDPRYGS